MHKRENIKDKFNRGNSFSFKKDLGASIFATSEILRIKPVIKPIKTEDTRDIRTIFSFAARTVDYCQQRKLDENHFKLGNHNQLVSDVKKKCYR